jgi:broad specificity phosphatase PhoE
MLDVYLTRHGETKWNVAWRMQGRKNSPLTDKGIQDAIDFRNKLDGKRIGVCFTSPMPRAVHTSQLIIGDQPVPFIIEPLLAEMDLGVWEGVYAKDAKNDHPVTFFNFRNRPDLYVPVEGGESFYHVTERAKAFLAKLEALPEGSLPVLAVTHCILLQSIIMLCDDREMSTLRTSQAVDQTRLFHLQWDNNTWVVCERNQ